MYFLLGVKLTKIVLKILRSKLFWILSIVSMLWILSSFSLMGFFIRTEILDNGEELVDASKAKAETIKEIYEDAIREEGVNPDEILGTPVLDFSPSIDVDEGTGTENTHEDYDETKELAEAIEGSSVLHQMHNAIVKETNSSKFSWFQYWLVIGKNMKESNGFGGSWIPHIGADRRGIQDPNFDINTWGVDKVTNFADIDHAYNSKTYIGPFQTGASYYINGVSKAGNWSLPEWVNKVKNNNTKRFDGNGDGITDPFNYLDALKAMHYHSEVKWNETNKYMSFVSDEYEDDMIGMSIAARYVGVSNSKGTKRFGAENGPWTGYTHHERINPHIQLMRKAAEEYHNNGMYFQKFKEYLLQSKSLNGTGIQHLVNDFFNANGWEATGNTSNGGSLTYTFPDGQTMKFTGQNMHYVFLVYWGGKVAEEEIQRILSSTQ